MKKTLALALISAATFVFSLTEAQAFVAKCAYETHTINFMQSYTESGTTFEAGFWSRGSIACKTHQGRVLVGKTDVSGVGLFFGGGVIPGGDWGKVAPESLSFYLSCPLISEKRLEKRMQKHGRIGFAGPKITGGGLVSIHAGVAVNGRGGLCFIGGPILGIGAQVGVTAITFTEMSKVPEKTPAPVIEHVTISEENPLVLIDDEA